MRQERGALTTPAGRVDSVGEAVCYLSTVIYWRLGGGKPWDGMGWDGIWVPFFLAAVTGQVSYIRYLNPQL
jgi:hypothetical protein